VGDLGRACGKEGRKEIILFSTSSRWVSKNDSLLGDRLRPELLLLLFGLKKKKVGGYLACPYFILYMQQI
jgi:hypothetical protein